MATQREGTTKDRRKGVGLLRSARCRLHVHFPLAVVLAIDRDKPRTWPRWRARQFPVPGPFLDEAVRRIAGAGRDRAAHRRRAILASATPCRDGLPRHRCGTRPAGSSRSRRVELAERVLAERWQRLAPDRQGLTLDKLSRTTGESALYEHVLEAARLLADRADTPTRDRAGVASGMRTGLARCAVDRTEALDEGRRSMPYVGQGSVGIALLLDGYLGHDDLADQIDRLARYAVPTRANSPSPATR